MPTATTIGGWAVILAVAGSFYWVNNQRKNKNRRAVEAKQSVKAPDTKKEQKAKKPRKDGGQSSGDQEVKSGKKTQKKAQAHAQSKPDGEDQAFTTSRESKDTDGEDVDVREFARAMANAKTGTLAAPKSQATSRPKSIKQTRAQNKPVKETSSENATAPSSTGDDADDDQSPTNSPEFSATNAKEPVASGDVSDMLEKPADGPSVLRVTAPTKPSEPKKPKSQANSEPAETKKQRQNRKKVEEKKAAREAEERERQALLEKQRRTAREAEGRAAKDGSAFMASQAPSKSAWTAPPTVNGSGSNPSPAKSVELLDTYEPTNGKAIATDKPAEKPAEKVYAETSYSESEEHGSQLAKEYALMTEDEQMRKVKEDSASWETVKAKDRRKKSNKNGGKETKDVKDDKPGSASEQSDYGVPPLTEPTYPGKKWDMTVTYVDENNNVVEEQLEVQDSEWEVA